MTVSAYGKPRDKTKKAFTLLSFYLSNESFHNRGVFLAIRIVGN